MDGPRKITEPSALLYAMLRGIDFGEDSEAWELEIAIASSDSAVNAHGGATSSEYTFQSIRRCTRNTYARTVRGIIPKYGL